MIEPCHSRLAPRRPPGVARRLPRPHDGRDGHRQRPRRLGPRLLAAASRGVERLDAHRPHLPVLPVHRRRLDDAFEGRPWGRAGRSVRRGLAIVALGALLAGFPRFPLATWRIPGVLVRIGLCYLAAVGIFRLTAPGPGRDDWRHGWRLLAWIVVADRRLLARDGLRPVSRPQPGRPDTGRQSRRVHRPDDRRPEPHVGQAPVGPGGAAEHRARHRLDADGRPGRVLAARAR